MNEILIEYQGIIAGRIKNKKNNLHCEFFSDGTVKGNGTQLEINEDAKIYEDCGTEDSKFDIIIKKEKAIKRIRNVVLIPPRYIEMKDNMVIIDKFEFCMV